MKKLTKKKLKTVKGGTQAAAFRCQDDTDCPSYCTNEPGGPEFAYACWWNASCQRVVCPGP